VKEGEKILVKTRFFKEKEVIFESLEISIPQTGCHAQVSLEWRGRGEGLESSEALDLIRKLHGVTRRRRNAKSLPGLSGAGAVGPLQEMWAKRKIK